MTSPEPLFLRACRRQPVERTPIWMMRQAGRYLPSYRAVRERHTFLEMCRTPELACEVTLQPIDQLGFDAAILFSDILITLPAMGLEVTFPEKGPKIEGPVRDHAAIKRLAVPDPTAELGYVLEAVRQIRGALAGRVPLIGFAGAPFTMMTYAVEGGGSKDYTHTKQLIFGDPEAAHDLLDRLARTCAGFLEAQVAAGAQAVQMFDSWAGILSPQDFREFALRWATRVIDLLRASPTWRDGGVPIIYFVNGCAPYLADYASSGADVLGVDYRVDIGAVRARVGDGVALQGNMDPGALFLPPEQIRARVADVLARAGRVGHVFNLGHGVMPQTDPAHVRAMVEAVKELSARPDAVAT
ncbi:MAG: uroporphyrinogen decarboxylase [Kofleriaceae bacterium]|nr:uroporphyrinogen decarboxylase [Myxococcales bacterium]MCB9559233.1 uroporphyrinogen decarboxylase [Kofleriaceae bacterium]MCB9574875.1 uroporphyrinogen decarboxylase [Kofleriaceae bacterium]